MKGKEKMTKERKNKITLIIAVLVTLLSVGVAYAGEPGFEPQPQVLKAPPSPPAPHRVVEQEINVLSTPAAVEVEQPVTVAVKPQVSVQSEPVNISVEPRVRTFGGAPLTSVAAPGPVYEPYTVAEADQEPVVIEVIEEGPTTLDRLKEGVIQMGTFWKPLAHPNNPEVNATALTDANTFPSRVDKAVRNIAVKGTINSARRFGEGAWKVVTCPFEKAS